MDQDMRAALANLLQIAGIQPGEGEISAAQVQEAADKIKLMLAQLKKAADQAATSSSGGGMSTGMHRGGPHQNILITGQLGIIIHQLRQAISKLGGEVTIAKDVEQALHEYQKQDYSLVIIDLFMPTEREGLIVLEEIKKLSVVCQIQTQIIVLAPPSKEKGLRERCKSKGATVFLEKSEKWHETILKYYQGQLTSEQVEQA